MRVTLGLTAIATVPAYAGDVSWAFRLQYQQTGPALTVLAVCSPLLLGGWFLRARQLRGRLEHPVRAAGLEMLVVAGIVGLFAISLVGRDGSARVVELDPFSGDLSDPGAGFQLIGNFLMVTPVAAAAALRWAPLRRVRSAAIVGGALMLALEAAQFAVGGRVTSLQDWLLGTAGWTLTCVIVGAVIARRDPASPAERRRETQSP